MKKRKKGIEKTMKTNEAKMFLLTIPIRVGSVYLAGNGEVECHLLDWEWG